MSTRLLLVFFIGLLLSGCENTVSSNIGALPNINFSGYVFAGNVKNARVQAVGIDTNGQPNRDSNENFLGDSYFTNEQGYYIAQVGGAYLDSVLLVASFNKDPVEVTCLNADDLGGCQDSSGSVVKYGATYTAGPTEIRCAVPDESGACIDDSGNDVAFGDWYAVSEDFEMWASINLASEGEQYHITPITHLASKLAFAEFVSDGVVCGGDFCEPTDYMYSLFTPQKIHEANSRVKKIFLLDNDVHVDTRPWSAFVDEPVTDSIVKAEEAKHGLLAMTFQQFIKQRSALDSENTAKETLAWWVDSFLVYEGQMRGNDTRSAATKSFDLQTLYSNAVDVGGNFDDGDITLAVNKYNDILVAGLTNTLTQAEGEEYVVSIAEQIATVKTLVSDVQGWLVDFETNEYVSFLGDPNLAEDVTAMEAKISEFKQILAPELNAMFKPMAQFVEYGLTCARAEGNCDPGDPADVDDYFEYHTSVTFNAASNTLVMDYESSTGPVLKMKMTGVIENVSTSIEKLILFSFTELISVETSTGLVEVSAVEEFVYPAFLFLMGSDLEAGEAPDIQAIKASYPNVKVQAKVPVSGEPTTSGYLDLHYVAENMALDMVGTKDATLPDAETHFNILSAAIPGEIRDGAGDYAESVEISLEVNSDIGDASRLGTTYTYYAPQKFPDLDLVLDMAALKQFTSLESGESVSFGASELAGWFAMPSDVVSDEVLVGAVKYVEQPVYNDLDSELKAILNLSGAFDFNYGALEYPGGVAAFVLWKDISADSAQYIRSCAGVEGVWQCNSQQLLTGLNSCEVGVDGTASDVVYNAPSDIDMPGLFSFLRDSDCIPQVKIQGRGVYDIDYPVTVENEPAFVANDSYDISLNKPYQLTMTEFNVRLVTNFIDEATLDENNIPLTRPRIQLIVFGGAPDNENVSLSVILTPGYIGEAAGIPYGDRSLMILIGSIEGSNSDSLLYYIQNGDATLTMTAFQETADHPDAPLGYLRYAGVNVGTLSKEGSLYVVRYTDGSWQIL